MSRMQDTFDVCIVGSGAGGGSIARVEMGMIAVGPQSAGATPGPMCYGKGGNQPTITDANVVLGYISPEWFNAGEMPLDADAAAAGIKEHVATPLGAGNKETEHDNGHLPR